MTDQDNHLETELNAFIQAQLGAAARVVDLQTADGHAGLTFLFAVLHADARREYVLRLPPKGVRRKGNTDVYRQAPLLQALHGAGLPVPAICWARPDEEWFGVPFIIMERLPGRTFLIWDPHPEFERTPEAIRPLWEKAAVTLAGFHRFDWQTALSDWEAPRPLDEEIAFWRPIYERAPEPEWIEAAQAVETLLLGSVPDNPHVGLVHGDYQLGNILFQKGQPVGVVDWELAHIGAQTLDLGWLMMMADPAMWHADYRPYYPAPLAGLQSAYEQAVHRAVPDASWYQALAGYRFGSIACLNVKLHRKGQREDPLWEKIARSVPSLFGHARHILQQYSGSR